MRVFLWIFFLFFNYYFKEGHCIPAFISGVLLSPESRTYSDCWVSLVGFWPRLFAQGNGCTLCLWIESLCSARLVCWGFCWDKPANLKSCDGPLAGLCKQPDLSLAPHASCLSSPSTGEWFQHSDPCCSGTGLWLLGKAGFFSAPASCQHGSCPSPGSGVGSHSGWVSMSPLMRRWTRQCSVRREQSELCLISVSSPVSSYDNWFATEAVRTSWDTKAWGCVILLGFQALHCLLVIAETY